MKTSSKTIIKLKDVWKTYLMGKVSLDVLRGINLNIYRGEFVAILGPSGSGKSTLLNAIYGLIDISEGEIIFQNSKVTGPKSNLVPGHPQMRLAGQFHALQNSLSVIDQITDKEF